MLELVRNPVAPMPYTRADGLDGYAQDQDRPNKGKKEKNELMLENLLAFPIIIEPIINIVTPPQVEVWYMP